MSTESDALKVFKKTLQMCQQKVARAPGRQEVLQSIQRQLEYLIDVATDPLVDRSRLKDIILAIYSVREFETDDPVFADLLSQSDNYARILRSGSWSP